MDMAREIAAQRAFFESGRTRPVEWRLEQLAYLKKAIKQYEQDLLTAVEEDLGKSAFESFATELVMVYDEIDFAAKHLKEWAKEKRVKPSLAQLPGKGYVYQEPRGVVLIIAPWNYPIQLTLLPLVSAIAAGNCVALKPSEYAVHTSQAVAGMLRECFPSQFISVYEGGPEVTQALIGENIDYIFFTGSTAVGREIMKMATERLIPMTLELGGKSPCIVERTANLELTAKRIMWGKLINAGQTCVAPDYILVHTDVKAQLMDELAKASAELYPGDILTNPDYPHIINAKHFDRLVAMLEQGKVVYGGQHDRDSLKIAPTILDSPRLDSDLMKTEIFGPLLPILNFEAMEDAFALIRRRHKPLALYVFSEDPAVQERVMREMAFGGGCINDTILHLTNPRMPFGGIGGSGMGAYHGKAGFEAFSHQKSVFKQGSGRETNLRYPPYGDKLKLLKKIYKK